jgi:hypothetical protein
MVYVAKVLLCDINDIATELAFINYAEALGRELEELSEHSARLITPLLLLQGAMKPFR